MISNDHYDDAVDAWDHPVLHVTTDRPERRLLFALLDELDALDNELNRVLANHHVETADGGALERMALLTNTSRRDGESNDYYRYRLIAEGAVKRIQPTFEELASFVLLVLDATDDEVSFTTDLDSNPATFEVTAPTAVFEDAPLDRNDVDQYVERALPMGHSFNRVET